jgi:hypothetical protein
MTSHIHWAGEGPYAVEVYDALQVLIEAGREIPEDGYREATRLARSAGYRDAIVLSVIYPAADLPQPARDAARSALTSDYLGNVTRSSELLSGAARTSLAALTVRHEMEAIGETYSEGWDRKDAEDSARHTRPFNVYGGRVA